DQWTKLGTYRQQIYIDPNRLLKFNLEYNRKANVKVRLRFFIQEGGGDGNLANNYLLDFSENNEEQLLPLKPADIRRFASASIEVMGKGQVTIGMLHSRWSRDGKGDYLPGGRRLIDPATGADIAYYFNPGDLQPPLHVYFSVARELEGFEAYPLFRRNHTPTLLFTDPRLAVG
ncbi:accessory Sec system protein Asp2, partial [Lactobacillus reuteri]